MAPKLRPETSLENTPLVVAAMMGRRETTEALIDAGAEVNSKGAQGQTALHYACIGQEAASKLLQGFRVASAQRTTVTAKP